MNCSFEVAVIPDEDQLLLTAIIPVCLVLNWRNDESSPFCKAKDHLNL
jgi:hypothetical protein